MSSGIWTVFVDDNFHYMDENERYTLGTFDSYEAALAACKEVVDCFLLDNQAKTADALYESYITYGDDPWIKGPPTGPDVPGFSAWDYARRRCNEILP